MALQSREAVQTVSVPGAAAGMGEVWVPEAASSVAGVPVPNRATELQLGIQVLLHVHAHLAN